MRILLTGFYRIGIESYPVYCYLTIKKSGFEEWIVEVGEMTGEENIYASWDLYL